MVRARAYCWRQRHGSNRPRRKKTSNLDCHDEDLCLPPLPKRWALFSRDLTDVLVEAARHGTNLVVRRRPPSQRCWLELLFPERVDHLITLERVEHDFFNPDVVVCHSRACSLRFGQKSFE